MKRYRLCYKCKDVDDEELYTLTVYNPNKDILVSSDVFTCEHLLTTQLDTNDLSNNII